VVLRFDSRLTFSPPFKTISIFLASWRQLSFSFICFASGRRKLVWCLHRIKFSFFSFPSRRWKKMKCSSCLKILVKLRVSKTTFLVKEHCSMISCCFLWEVIFSHFSISSRSMKACVDHGQFLVGNLASDWNQQIAFARCRPSVVDIYQEGISKLPYFLYFLVLFVYLP
jgi:hypothetical protein